jgi:hypothetical protein
MNHSDAVAEIVGTLVLIAVVAGVIGIVAVIILSQPVPANIPAVRINALLSGNNLTLTHTGGDTLPAGEYQILVNSVDKTSQFQPSPSNTPFKTGSDLTYSSADQIRMVQMIYKGNAVPEGVQLYQKHFP